MGFIRAVTAQWVLLWALLPLGSPPAAAHSSSSGRRPTSMHDRPACLAVHCMSYVTAKPWPDRMASVQAYRNPALYVALTHAAHNICYAFPKMKIGASSEWDEYLGFGAGFRQFAKLEHLASSVQREWKRAAKIHKVKPPQNATTHRPFIQIVQNEALDTIIQPPAPHHIYVIRTYTVLASNCPVAPVLRRQYLKARRQAPAQRVCDRTR
mmetsp:Transcript_64980/g.115649  ORF Transcript_64980/g.115649 Transcript_64980/m.115649 type:complete len:210 (-) Transcript_64980:31-660(-)